MPASSPCWARCSCARSATNGPHWPAGIAYAITDEVHQLFVPGRVGAPLDVVIDSVGVAAGVLLWRRYAQARRTR
jgi:VanZ family protein